MDEVRTAAEEYGEGAASRFLPAGQTTQMIIGATPRSDGEILAKASADREETIFAEVEWNRVKEHRTHWPFLRDRRVDAYAGLEQRLLD